MKKKDHTYTSNYFHEKHSRRPHIRVLNRAKKIGMKLWNRDFFRFDYKDILLILGAFGVVLIASGIFTYFLFAHDLASKDSIMNRNNTGVVLLDSAGKPFFSFYEGRTKTFVPLADIPKDLQHAVIAAEDKDFYTHPGFSLKAIVGALIADIKKQELQYGGSTLTQQLVKNSLLTHEKSFFRKYQEIILSFEIERRYKKQEILEMYLNSVYFGEGAYGVEEAAQAYFGKPVKNLALAESAQLAALPVAPSSLSPISGDSVKAEGRRLYILNELKEQGYITPEQEKQAVTTKLVFKTQNEDDLTRASHFALMVKDKLIRDFGEEKISRSGFQVYTTLDMSWQEYAEDQVKSQVSRLKSSRVSNGAAVVMNSKSGEIKALVGSHDWYDSTNGKINMATTPRQPGSSFKPIVYLAGFESRLITPATVLKDEPRSFPQTDGSVYKPVNYDGTFRGNVLVRRALANSLNIPAIEVMEKVGIAQSLEMADRLGITTLQDPSRYGLSLVLGSGEVPLTEMTSAYATFANQGIRAEPYFITKIDDKNGKRIFTAQPQSEKVLDPEYPFLISSILSDNNARQEEFGNVLTISRPAAVKTGTTNDYKDSWTIGYTPSLTVGVWIGNNDNTEMERVAGSIGAAPIWRNLMERFSRGTPVEQFSPPSRIKRVTVCRRDGQLYSSSAVSDKLSELENDDDIDSSTLDFYKNLGSSFAYPEYFVAGTEPKKMCGIPTPTPTATSSATPSITPTESDKDDDNEEQSEEERRQEEQRREEEERKRAEERERIRNEIKELRDKLKESVPSN